MAAQEKYQPTEKAQAFIDKVENAKYKREIVMGLKRFRQQSP